MFQPSPSANFAGAVEQRGRSYVRTDHGRTALAFAGTEGAELTSAAGFCMEVEMALGQEKTVSRIFSREVRGCMIVGLNGGCDDVCAEELGREVDALVDSGHRALVLDLSRARYVESSGFRIILNKLTRLHELGGELVVAGLHGTASRAFKLLKLDHSVPVADDVTAALQTLCEPQQKAS